MRKQLSQMIACAAAIGGGVVPAHAGERVEIRTSDVALFFRLYDTAGGTPAADVLQRAYIDAGSDGVRQFVPNRIVSGETLAKVIRQNRPVYDDARACMDALPKMAGKLETAFRKLENLVPDPTFPPVTILVGANNSGGTTGKSGVLIGLEVACRSSWLQPDISERLFHLIAHEYAHVQQSPTLNDEDAPTSVLRQSLIEGIAELVAELISGEVSNVHLQAWTRGRVAQIDTAFVADAAKADISDWLYNGVGTPDQPGDLGYWEGYRIAKSYYAKATDKRAALRTLLELKSPEAVLLESGWKPGHDD